MKRAIIAVIIAVLALVCGVLILQGIRSSRAVPVPVAGATYQELNSFANLKVRAAPSLLPPLRELSFVVGSDRITLITGWSLRRGHPFLVHSVEYLYRYSDPRTAILRDGPSGWGIYGGTNISRWKWKWDL
jgi:hypothetical protein